MPAQSTGEECIGISDMEFFTSSRGLPETRFTSALPFVTPTDEERGMFECSSSRTSPTLRRSARIASCFAREATFASLTSSAATWVGDWSIPCILCVPSPWTLSENDLVSGSVHNDGTGGMLTSLWKWEMWADVVGSEEVVLLMEL